MSQVYWTGTLPDRDDFGLPYKDEMYDAATTFGPWANMTKESFKKHGVGLGMGKGQKYKKQPDGRWLKVSG